MDGDLTENISYRKKVYDSLKWCHEENVFRIGRKYREEKFSRYTFSFSSGLNAKFRKSIFGTYLEEFNKQQHQNKNLNENKLTMTLWDLARMKEKEKKKVENQNKLLDKNYMETLKEAVRNYEVIDHRAFQGIINENLRLNNIYINEINKDLRLFTDINCLVLSGNNIRDIKGSYLPRKLVFLELYDNFISDLKNFVRGAPKHLMHIGLGRNKLHDGSNLHLLVKSGKFVDLRSLDFSNNAISELEPLLAAINGLEPLTSLALEGNPCSVVRSYKDIVLHYIPHLEYLDNVQFLEEDRNINCNFGDGGTTASMTFTCYRMIALPKPPNEKKAKQTIHLEIQLPLLEEEHLIEPEPVKNVPLEEAPEDTTEKEDKKGKAESNKSSKKSSGKSASPYAKPNEYNAEEEKNNYSFKSERMQWGKLMSFPPIIIDPPERDLSAISNTFKSRVKVNVIYLKILPSKTEKKGKTKENKKGDKQNKNSETPEPVVNVEPPEIIEKRVTLCSFYCELNNLNWSDETVDFYWADHPKTAKRALRVEGSLKAIKYSDKPSKQPTRKGKEKSNEAEEVINIAELEQPFPKIFTCQVGFGLIRT